MMKSVKARCRGLKYNMPLSSFLHLLGISFLFFFTFVCLIPLMLKVPEVFF